MFFIVNNILFLFKPEPYVFTGGLRKYIRVFYYVPFLLFLTPIIQARRVTPGGKKFINQDVG